METEPNVEETLALAKKVLSNHRSWLKKKSATVSPIAGEMDYDFKGYSSPTTFSINTSTPRPRQDHVGEKDCKDERFVLSKEDTTIQSLELDNSDKRIRKKRRSKATVVPVDYATSTDTNAWEQQPEVSTSLESNDVNRKLRLEERLADVQGSSDHDHNENGSPGASEDDIMHPPSLLFHSRSVTNTASTHDRERPSLQKKSSTPNIVSFVTPANGQKQLNPLSSIVMVKPGTVKRKKLSRNKIQPIHVVEPSKPPVPIRIHQPLLTPSSPSEGDIVLEDAEDWIPPEEVLRLKPKSDQIITHVKQQDDIKISDAVGHHIVQFPIKKDIENRSTSEIANMNDQQVNETEVSLLSRNVSNKLIPFSPKSNKKGSNETVIEDMDNVPLPLKPQDSTVQLMNQSTIHGSVADAQSSYGSDDEADGHIPSVLTCSPSLVRKPELRGKGSDANEEQHQKESSKLVTTEQQEKGEESAEKDQEINDDIIPLLRVKSVSSIYTPDFKFSKKRDRVPPEYHIHCRQSTPLLPPACPIYGTKQPTHSEVLGSSNANISPLAPVTKPLNTRPHSTDHVIRSSVHDPAVTISTNIDTSTPLGPSELHIAARDGNLRKLQVLLSNGHNVDELDNDGRTPIMYCVLPNGKAQLHCVDLLMKMGSNLDHQSNEGYTVLHLASYCGIVSLMELLIMNGANVDLKDIDGRLPLHWSTCPISTKPIDLLLKHSVNDVHVVDHSEMTLLMWSCYNCNATVTKYLLMKGADPEEKDNEGKTAMHWACSQNDIHCLQLLLTPDMTYFKDHKGCTVIHTAAQYGFILGVQFIISKRTESVYDIDKEGRTPLHYAAASDRVDICYLLLNKGADATRTDNHGLTALEYAKKTCNEYVVALFTCHKSSMADFTRKERTLRNDTRRLTARSHDTFDTITQESLLSHDFDTISLATTVSTSTKFETDDECIEQASIGCYLGYFTYHDHHKVTEKELKDPPCHYYFWMSPKDKLLCWSRSKSRQSKIMSIKITKVEEGPSIIVKSRPDYSPQDLHQFAFRVWLEGDQPLDLLAYTSDYYYMWTVGIRALIDKVEELPEETGNTTDTSHKASSVGLKKGLELM